MSAIMESDEGSKFKTIETYNAAAPLFDAEPLSFWDRHGRGAVNRAHIEPGNRILDVGCGTGASALPAAELAGASGVVIGIDAARNMLERAREKAAAQELTNVRLECADMAKLDFADGHFDRIISVFAIFFLEDMTAHLRELWRMLRPGGRMVVTTWGPRAFQPCAGIFADCAARLGYVSASPPPWERLNGGEKLKRLFAEADAGAPLIDTVMDQQPFNGVEDWWAIVMGSGYRAVVDQLPQERGAALKEAVLAELMTRGIDCVETNVLHATAEKPE